MVYTVGVADMKLSSDSADMLITYALGSCLGVTVYDFKHKKGALLHCMMPDSGIDRVKAAGNPYLYVDSGMKVMIPVQNAEAIGLRSIISKREVKKVIAVLSKDESSSVDDWKERYQNNIDKVKSGSIYEVSEVARDLFRRGSEKELSIMERKLYENAYQLVAHEIALAKEVDFEEAGNIVSEALSAYQPKKV